LGGLLATVVIVPFVTGRVYAMILRRVRCQIPAKLLLGKVELPGQVIRLSMRGMNFALTPLGAAQLAQTVKQGAMCTIMIDGTKFRTKLSYMPNTAIPTVGLRLAIDLEPKQHRRLLRTCSMGHFMGLLDTPWLGIPPTGKMTFLRYAEFHRIEDGKIAETALFCDVLAVMAQAGVDPLPPQTGASFVIPGPQTNDGLLHSEHPAENGAKTLALVNRMAAGISKANEAMQGKRDRYLSPHDEMAENWHDDMIWYGPHGIGSTYTIDRYIQQHQAPFRTQLKDRVFNGHVSRLAEGNYCAFFGWPNLTVTPTGGYMGLPGTGKPADMRVVDVYRRDGDKLAENWVIIDMLHFLKMQGLDVLERLNAGVR